MKQLFSNGFGIIVFYAGACGAIYLLQLIPVTGIFLMFFLAAFWVGILNHIMMTHLLIAGATRKISPWWLVVPICYYAGGFLLFLYSRQQAHIQVAEIEAGNAAAKTTVERPFIYMFRYSHEERFFERYQADRAFITEAKEFEQYDYARGPACKANIRWDYEKRYEPYMRRADIFPNYKGPDKIWQCIITKNVKSAEWRYRLETESISPGTYINPRFGQVWRMIDDKTGHAVATVKTASIGMLPPIQTFFAGCGLNSGAARWDCGAGLWPSSARVTAGYVPRPSGGNPFTPSNDPDTWPESALGRALSLEPRRPNR